MWIQARWTRDGALLRTDIGDGYGWEVMSYTPSICLLGVLLRKRDRPAHQNVTKANRCEDLAGLWCTIYVDLPPTKHCPRMIMARWLDIEIDRQIPSYYADLSKRTKSIFIMSIYLESDVKTTICILYGPNLAKLNSHLLFLDFLHASSK